MKSLSGVVLNLDYTAAEATKIHCNKAPLGTYRTIPRAAFVILPSTCLSWSCAVWRSRDALHQLKVYPGL